MDTIHQNTALLKTKRLPCHKYILLNVCIAYIYIYIYVCIYVLYVDLNCSYAPKERHAPLSSFTALI